MPNQLKLVSTMGALALAMIAAAPAIAAGPVTHGELAGQFWTAPMMKAMDANKDGMVSRDEYLSYLGAQFDRSEEAMRPVAADVEFIGVLGFRILRQPQQRRQRVGQVVALPLHARDAGVPVPEQQQLRLVRLGGAGEGGGLLAPDYFLPLRRRHRFRRHRQRGQEAVQRFHVEAAVGDGDVVEDFAQALDLLVVEVGGGGAIGTGHGGIIAGMPRIHWRHAAARRAPR